ncbi:FAD-binding oxidoreductase [Chelativorans sp. M5D2P16]|uniref:NAD(P)/FAD-dependent oxidoreductase n=1 Tax=Chelativorans sp. M5D2P16 TaxID=3095678 RepID=UPI002AC9F76A|nr:FAD-binding oxidoreductase [Chelativorans sp. M5D2P16]MDZ5697710.1 FAD-binding oxidoreductase [Chelativorans sp. M5D2P16]
MSEAFSTDILIVGAGIAGVGLAAALGRERDVILLEQEERPGHHASGRSAAIFVQNYGNAVIRTLSRASLPLFVEADSALFPTPLLSPRGILFVTNENGLDAYADLLGSAEGLEKMDPYDATAMVPLLKREWIAAAAYEPDAMDIDVAALHQGWLKGAKRSGARLLTSAGLMGGTFSQGRWTVETTAGRVTASILVNAAGAWADHVAQACRVAPLGLQPFRRSMAVLPAPEAFDVSRWPLVDEAADNWYFKPETGRLLVSPADEDPVEPHDAFADDMVLAEGLHRYEQAVTVPVTRVEGSWAGLRTFAPDRTPVVGFDPQAENFFWLAGQGGYGMQTAPALSALAARVIEGAPFGELSATAAAMAPDRLRAGGTR